jgi:cbb3-type cytochrome oxidase subunit 3
MGHGVCGQKIPNTKIFMYHNFSFSFFLLFLLFFIAIVMCFESRGKNSYAEIADIVLSLLARF